MLRKILFAVAFASLSASSFCVEKIVDGFSQEAFSFSPEARKRADGTVEYSGKNPQWNFAIGTKKGLLKAGRHYLAEFKVRVSGGFDIDKKLECVVRNMKGYVAWGDLAVVNSYGTTDSFQNVSMRFDVPNDGEEYGIGFHVKGKTDLEFKDFALYDGDFIKNFPVTKNENPYYGDFPNLPKGAKDFNVAMPNPKNEIVVNAADFGMDEKSESNGTALKKAAEYCAKIRASKLVVNKGVYKFYEENSFPMFQNLEDFTFDANGSTFIYRRNTPNESMHINKCRRCEFKNFKVDWDWKTEPLAAIVKIVNVGKNQSGRDFYDVEFHEYKNDKYPLYGKPVSIKGMFPYDLKEQAVGVEGGNEGYYGFWPKDKTPDTEWLAENILRVYSPIALMKVGDYYRLQHFYYSGGCIFFGESDDITFKNIDVYSCKGTAVYSYADVSNIQLLNVNIKVPHIRRRPITSTSDHFYLSCPKGNIKIVGCEFSRGGDDCFNILGPIAYGFKISPDTLRIVSPTNIRFFSKNSTLELRDAKFFPFDKSASVKEVKNVSQSGNVYDLVFDTILPEERNGGFTLFNPAYRLSNTIVKDSYFHHNRARGLLLQTSNITVENCRFVHNEMAALRLEAGYALGIWSEGVFSQNIVVRNCSFESSNSTGVKSDAYETEIIMGSFIKTYPVSSEQTDYPVVRNILFENNTFKNSFGLVARISSAENVVFRNNTFTNSIPRKLEKDYRACFFVRDSSNVKIVDNTWVESPLIRSPRVMVDSSAKDVVVSGNRIIDD